MLSPKRLKYRKTQRGRIKGDATRGNTVAFGDFGLVAVEPKLITNRQIEAARIAMTRHIKRGGKVWIRIFRINPIPRNPRKPGWVRVKVTPKLGLPLLNPVP